VHEPRHGIQPPQAVGAPRINNRKPSFATSMSTRHSARKASRATEFNPPDSPRHGVNHRSHSAPGHSAIARHSAPGHQRPQDNPRRNNQRPQWHGPAAQTLFPPPTATHPPKPSTGQPPTCPANPQPPSANPSGQAKPVRHKLPSQAKPARRKPAQPGPTNRQPAKPSTGRPVNPPTLAGRRPARPAANPPAADPPSQPLAAQPDRPLNPLGRRHFRRCPPRKPSPNTPNPLGGPPTSTLSADTDNSGRQVPACG
jgi:hypothetical protein